MPSVHRVGGADDYRGLEEKKPPITLAVTFADPMVVARELPLSQLGNDGQISTAASRLESILLGER